MKKLIFATLLMLSFALIPYCKPANESNGLIKEQPPALKNTGHVATITSESYQRASFYFNGKMGSVFYDAENDKLIGFSIPIQVTD